jgi:hypothetical protein
LTPAAIALTIDLLQAYCEGKLMGTTSLKPLNPAAEAAMPRMTNEGIIVPEGMHAYIVTRLTFRKRAKVAVCRSVVFAPDRIVRFTFAPEQPEQEKLDRILLDPESTELPAYEFSITPGTWETFTCEVAIFAFFIVLLGPITALSAAAILESFSVGHGALSVDTDTAKDIVRFIQDNAFVDREGKIDATEWQSLMDSIKGTAK